MGGGAASRGLFTNRQVILVGAVHFLGGTIMRIPWWRLPLMEPPRASTMKLTRNLRRRRPPEDGALGRLGWGIGERGEKHEKAPKDITPPEEQRPGCLTTHPEWTGEETKSTFSRTSGVQLDLRKESLSGSLATPCCQTHRRMAVRPHPAGPLLTSGHHAEENNHSSNTRETNGTN